MMPFKAMQLRRSAYLNQLSVQPTAVLSLRKLISSATVSIRVRRSSDNAEQDIGFIGKALDTAALASFVGANSAYVTKFYDQTGNGEHAENATSASQPRIVNAGVYDGKLVFDGTDDFLKITSLAQGTPYLGIYLNIRHAIGAANQVVIEGSTSVVSNAQTFQIFTSNVSLLNAWCMMANNAAAAFPNRRNNVFSGASATTLKQVTALYDRTLTGTAEAAMWVTGVSQTATANETVEATGNFTAYDTYIGARAGTTIFASMDLETLVFYNADTVGIRPQIEVLVA